MIIHDIEGTVTISIKKYEELQHSYYENEFKKENDKLKEEIESKKEVMKLMEESKGYALYEPFLWFENDSYSKIFRYFADSEEYVLKTWEGAVKKMTVKEFKRFRKRLRKER